MTAREMGEKFNLSTRTIQRIFSQPREEYENNSISRAKPWEDMGISRATWYRRGKPSPPEPEEDSDWGADTDWGF